MVQENEMLVHFIICVWTKSALGPDGSTVLTVLVQVPCKAVIRGKCYLLSLDSEISRVRRGLVLHFLSGVEEQHYQNLVFSQFNHGLSKHWSSQDSPENFSRKRE